MADKLVHTHLNGRGNELRDWSLEKLAAHPTAYAGRFYYNTVDQGFYYCFNGVNFVRLSTVTDVEDRPRLVGSLNVSTGTVPLVTPLADINAETTWDAGDKGYVTVGGTLVPAPAGGNVLVQPGDMIVALVDNPTSNADFIVVEQNLPGNLPLVENFIVATGDWVFNGTDWGVTKSFTNPNAVLQSYFVQNDNTKFEEIFSVLHTPGIVILYANVAPIDQMNLNCVIS